jgi:hypothetical protein
MKINLKKNKIIKNSNLKNFKINKKIKFNYKKIILNWIKKSYEKCKKKQEK